MSKYEETARRWPELWQCLSRARRSGRLAHAFLIRSDLPRSREEFAVALAMLAACPAAAESGVPCGDCRACRQLENGSYPELYHLFPVGRAYQIQVGDRQNPEPNTVRYFEDQFFLTGTSGAACKVGIIHDADRMGDEAQNALLKTLEEPPPETLIILTTGNVSALLPTTRSRCQQLSLPENRIEFDFPGHEELAAVLCDLYFQGCGDVLAAERAAARMIALAGRLREEAEKQVREEWQGRLEAAAAVDGTLSKRLEKQQESAAAGAYMKSRAAFLSMLHTFFAQLYLLSVGVSRESLANPEIMVLPSDSPLKPERAAKVLRETEKLLFDLRFNVNEELAYRTFALQSALC